MHCIFKKIIINESNFIASDLTDSIIQGDILEDCSFGKSILIRTDFSGSTFKGRLWSNPTFINAEAPEINFSNCKMYFVGMGKANLENAIFLIQKLNYLMHKLQISKMQIFQTHF